MRPHHHKAALIKGHERPRRAEVENLIKIKDLINENAQAGQKTEDGQALFERSILERLEPWLLFEYMGGTGGVGWLSTLSLIDLKMIKFNTRIVLSIHLYFLFSSFYQCILRASPSINFKL